MVKIIDYKPHTSGVEVEVLGMFGIQKMVLNCTETEFETGLKRYANGALMQDAFKKLNATQREFLISGMPADEQDEFFKAPEDEVTD